MKDSDKPSGYDSDPDNITLQQKPILLYKEKLALQKDIKNKRIQRCQCKKFIMFNRFKIRSIYMFICLVCVAAEKPRLTVPDAYEFDDREKTKSQSQSIRQRRVSEIVAAAAAKDEMEMSKTFHPKPIPDHVKNVHLFE